MQGCVKSCFHTVLSTGTREALFQTPARADTFLLRKG